jgi:hypothetical protein
LNVCLRLWLTCPLLSACCCWRRYLCRVSLALTWPRRLCLLRVLLCRSLCYKLSPFQALGEVTLHLLSQAGVFTYSSCGRWVFPALLCSFPPTATFTSFPAPGCWAVLPLLPSPAGLFIYSSMRDFPSPPLRCSGRPALFAMCLFCCYCLLFWVFFSLGGGRSVQGAMLIWPRVVCGSTTCRLAHLVVCVFPSHLDSGIWQPGGPPGFSV